MNKRDLIKYLIGGCFGFGIGVFAVSKPYQKLIHKMQEDDKEILDELNKMIERVKDDIAMNTTTYEA